ncbi:amidohydrolase family protein [Schauerella aestuarii]|uniref:amidohydrolase family protein n=1 Tax=Schauerella aestuarii TaxID=2511204 RepID=UPI001F249D99|nr:amidohydrolase family protein [Achromobacter aestuarii]
MNGIFCGIGRRLPVHRAALALGVGAVLAVPMAWAAADTPRNVLIKNGYVLTMDGALGDLPRADVRIRAGRISDVGPGLTADPSSEIIDAAGQVVMPGFVDTHSHLWITALRGQYRNTPDTAFFTTTNRLAPHFTPDDTYVGILLGTVEGAYGGITTMTDFFDNVQTRDHMTAALAALRDAPLRARLLYGAQSKTTARQTDLPHVQALAQDWGRHSADGRISLGLAWRLPPKLDDATVWPAKLEELDTARRLKLPVAVHVSGNAEAMFDALISRRLLGPDMQVVHATDARSDQIAALNQAGASLALTPLTEQRVGYGLTVLSTYADVQRLGLGIDGNALAGSADMFGTMRLAALTQAGEARRETLVSPRDLLALATIRGAAALGMHDQVGSLTPGKRADVQIIDMNALNIGPYAGGDPSAWLVYSATPANVRTVIADGRVVKRDGAMVGIDVPALMQRARASVAGILERAEKAAPVNAK